MINKDTLKQLISEHLKGIIWKIVLDDQKQLMVIETRTPEKETFFYVYDFNNQQFLWLHEQLKSELSLVLHSCFNGIIYFQSMQSGPVPDYSFLLAFDAYSRNLLFEKYTHHLEAISETGVVAFAAKILPKKFELLDLKNGQLIKALSYPEMASLAYPGNEIILPEDHFGETPWDTYQQLDFGRYSIKASYEAGKTAHNHLIEVFDQGQRVLKDYLNQGIQKLHQDTFFVWFGKLVYIRNKQEIVSYLL